MKEKKIPRQYARFHWFAAVALALLLIEPLISERRRRSAQSGVSDLPPTNGDGINGQTTAGESRGRISETSNA